MMGITTGVRKHGSVRPAKDRKGRKLRNVWDVTYSWQDKITGERRKQTKRVHGSERDGWNAWDKMKRMHDDGLRLDGSQVSFAEFAADWQEAREESGELADKTLEESERHVRVLSEYIGNKALTDINAETVERLLRDLRKDRKGKGGAQLSGRTLQAYFQCLKQIMQKACDYDYILRNPCAKVKPPKPAEVERRALSTKDARRLLATLEQEESKERAAFEAKEQRQIDWKANEGRGAIRGLKRLSNLVGVRLALATGMRVGEIFGLTWQCVDLKEQCLEVKQSLTAKGKLKPPKSKESRRVIWLDQATAAHLAEWKRFQTEQLRKIGKIQDGQRLPGSVPVICSDVGGYANVSNFGDWWRAWRKSHGFGDLKMHELRHTQATQLLANGVDVKTVQTRLGHADPALTLKWYAHSVEENDRQAAALIGGLLASAEQAKRAS